MLSILSTVIGIVFIMLLFSLLASTVMELIAGYLSLRGKQLVDAIKGMIGSETCDEFVQHPFFEQLAVGSREKAKVDGKKRALPAWINANTFTAILMDVMNIDGNTNLEEKLNSLPEGPPKKLAVFLYKQSNGELQDLKQRVESWYNEVMERASAAYKRKAHAWLVGIGLVLAVIFNADVINIYHNLSINATLSNMVADQAASFMNTQAAPAAPNLENPDIAEAKAKIGQLVNENIAALESPLGLGWDTVDWSGVDLKWWIYKIIGWLTTALGVSLGATFWFETLKKLVTLRSSATAAAAPAPATNNQPASTPVLSNPETSNQLEKTSRTRKKPEAKG